MRAISTNYKRTYLSRLHRSEYRIPVLVILRELDMAVRIEIPHGYERRGKRFSGFLLASTVACMDSLVDDMNGCRRRPI